MEYLIISVIIIFFVLISGTIIWRRSQKQKQFQKISSRTLSRLQDLEERNISHFEYFLALDGIVDKMVRESGYTESFGNNLKKEPAILTPYLDEVWKYHKIRNTLAHSHGNTLSMSLREEGRNYHRLITNICKNHLS